MFVRKDWIDKTEFHPHSSKEVLDEVMKRCQDLLDKGKLPIVVFDLDSTLFNVSGRSYQILREWLAHPEAMSFEETLSQLKDVEVKELKYSLEELWEHRKIPYEKEPYAHHLNKAKGFWRKRFFGNDYLIHDEPTAGAVKFVHQLYEIGVQIVYLTGRDVPLMSFGTFDQLKKHKLPIEVERTRLILKPKRHIDDLEFKFQAAQTIKGWGTVVASFENEPKNLMKMAGAFGPETMNVFIESVASDHPAPAGKEIYRIHSFER